MHSTIFDTPILRTLLRWFSLIMLRLLGWRLHGAFPADKKYVLIGAPHTSNWDFPYTLMFCFAGGAKLYWMGKHTLFTGAKGPIMRWLGGIPVDRRQKNSLVEQMVEVFHRSQQLAVAIPPEGTRAKVAEWKTGFYHIACGAGVPIALGYLDFDKKQGGVMGMFQPSGDIARDMPLIRAQYQNVTGKCPQNQ